MKDQLWWEILFERSRLDGFRGIAPFSVFRSRFCSDFFFFFLVDGCFRQPALAIISCLKEGNFSWGSLW